MTQEGDVGKLRLPLVGWGRGPRGRSATLDLNPIPASKHAERLPGFVLAAVAVVDLAGNVGGESQCWPLDAAGRPSPQVTLSLYGDALNRCALDWYGVGKPRRWIRRAGRGSGPDLALDSAGLPQHQLRFPR